MGTVDDFLSFRQLRELASEDEVVNCLLVELLDHPNAHARERVADVIFWLLGCEGHGLMEHLIARIRALDIGHGRELAAGIVHAFAASNTERAKVTADLLDREGCVDDANLLVRYALGEALRLGGRAVDWSSPRAAVVSVDAVVSGYQWSMEPDVLAALGSMRGLAEARLQTSCAPFAPADVQALLAIRSNAFDGRVDSRRNPWEREAVFCTAAELSNQHEKIALIRYASWNPRWPEAAFDHKIRPRRDDLLAALAADDLSRVLLHDDKVLLHLREFQVANGRISDFEVLATLVSDVYFDGNLDLEGMVEVAGVHDADNVATQASRALGLSVAAVRTFSPEIMAGGDVTPAVPSQMLMSALALRAGDFERLYWHEGRLWRPWGAGPLPSFGTVLRMPKQALRNVPGHDLVWIVRRAGRIVVVLDPRRGRAYRGST